MSSAADFRISYSISPKELTPAMLVGFFEGWQHPLSPDEHLRLLRGSTHCVLAIDDQTGRGVGFINALTDGCQSAFIPLLEVLPAYRRRGIGGELLRRMLAILAAYPCLDLTCDPDMQPFYEKYDMVRSVGMVIRNYHRSGPR